MYVKSLCFPLPNGVSSWLERAVLYIFPMYFSSGYKPILITKLILHVKSLLIRLRHCIRKPMKHSIRLIDSSAPLIFPHIQFCWADNFPLWSLEKRLFLLIFITLLVYDTLFAFFVSMKRPALRGFKARKKAKQTCLASANIWCLPTNTEAP